jgi:site-specific DNA-methyltransferase (cytosine-N4-specific)
MQSGTTVLDPFCGGGTTLSEAQRFGIRRRRTPLPQTGFREAFLSDANAFAERLAEAQSVLGTLRVDVQARLMDSRRLTFPHTNGCRRKFDCVLTSPPYATALPYIDTQRLSLVWLGLLSPSEVMRLDAELIGSREVRGVSKKNLLLALLGNRADLPARQADFCRGLQSALSKDDGFRRKATPMLLYRYFARMADTFRSANFTGPGMSQNAEVSILLDGTSTAAMNFSWDELMKNLLAQRWDFYQPVLSNRTAPAWQLLYDEQAPDVLLDESDEVTMVLLLSHSDRRRAIAHHG